MSYKEDQKSKGFLSAMTDDKNKIIDLTEILQSDKHHRPWVQDGIDALESIPEQTANDIVTFILNMALTEVEIGLGLVEVDDFVDLKIFDRINEVYTRAAGGCYFCRKDVDPNAEQIGPDTKLCISCKLKLANYIQALGIHPGKVFKGMKKRRIQKNKIVLF